jgi:hypothetical protein
MAPQKDVAEERNIVIPGDLPAAGRAVRARPYDGLLARPTVNDHVKETAEDQPEKECVEYKHGSDK